MLELFIDTAPICLAAIGGAILSMSIFSLIGKADILMDFEHKHFSSKTQKILVKAESIFGIIASCLLFFCASALLFNNPEKISLANTLLLIIIAIYLIFYMILWIKKGKRNNKH